MKHFVIDGERMKYPNTGLYHYCLHLINAMAAQVMSGEETLGVYTRSGMKQQLPASTRILPQHDWHKVFFPNYSNINIWHCTNQGSDYFPMRLASKKILTIHDLNFLEEKKGRPGKIRHILQKIQRRINNADHLIAISAFTANLVKAHLDIQDKEISVVYNGCNITDHIPTTKPSISPTGDFIFTIGTVMAKKNFHVLPVLLKDNDLTLVIAGMISDPDYKQLIEKEAKSHGVSERVMFTGPVSETDKQWYYSNCTAFVFPSLTEGFGLPVIEAMYFSKPVILSKLTALPEIGGDIAYYFDDFDPDKMREGFQQAMDHFYSHPEWKGLSKDRAALFSWKESARQHLEIYRSL
jgi:glycosyltransferase involved in cell wall biosynthesis